MERIPIFGECPELTAEEIKEMSDEIKAEEQADRLRQRYAALTSKGKKLTAKDRAELDDISAELD